MICVLKLFINNFKFLNLFCRLLMFRCIISNFCLFFCLLLMICDDEFKGLLFIYLFCLIMVGYFNKLEVNFNEEFIKFFGVSFGRE